MSAKLPFLCKAWSLLSNLCFIDVNLYYITCVIEDVDFKLPQSIEVGIKTPKTRNMTNLNLQTSNR